MDSQLDLHTNETISPLIWIDVPLGRTTTFEDGLGGRVVFGIVAVGPECETEGICIKPTRFDKVIGVRYQTIFTYNYFINSTYFELLTYNFIILSITSV